MEKTNRKLYRIVEHSFKTDVKYGVQTIYYVQELTFWGWETIKEWVMWGSDTSLVRREFATKDEAIAYIKWLRTPLPKDKYTYI